MDTHIQWCAAYKELSAVYPQSVNGHSGPRPMGCCKTLFYGLAHSTAQHPSDAFWWGRGGSAGSLGQPRSGTVFFLAAVPGRQAILALCQIGMTRLTVQTNFLFNAQPAVLAVDLSWHAVRAAPAGGRAVMHSLEVA